MTSRLRVAAASTAVATLAFFGLGAMPASATNPNNLCTPSTDGVSVDAFTNDTFYFEVCVTSPTIEEADTQFQIDAFDTYGNLYFAYGLGDQVEIGANPADATYSQIDTNNWVFEFTDFGVDVALGAPIDLVNISVKRELSGSFIRTTITVRDADDNSVREDVPLTQVSNVGSDGSADFTIGANYQGAFGDAEDPLVLFAQDSASYLWSATPGNDTIELDFTGSIVTTVALVGYGCFNYAPAVTWLDTIGPTFTTLFGQTLFAPGTGPCVDGTSPIKLVTGQAFNRDLGLTYAPGGLDFSGSGGFAHLDEAPLFITGASTDEGLPGVAPKLSIFGTAPSTPGVYFIYVHAGEESEGPEAYVLLRVEVEAPALAATGAEVSPVGLALGGLLLLAGAAALVVVRRQRTA